LAIDLAAVMCEANPLLGFYSQVIYNWQLTHFYCMLKTLTAPITFIETNLDLTPILI
jgi:hypothetical protein